MDNLGTRLHEVMQELGIENPKALADFCGVTEGLVSQWFAGNTKLGPKPLKALARTHFSLTWIADGKLPKYRKEEGERQLSSVAVIQDMDTVPVSEITELINAYGNSFLKDRKSIMNIAKTSAERAARIRAGISDDKK